MSKKIEKSVETAAEAPVWAKDVAAEVEKAAAALKKDAGAAKTVNSLLQGFTVAVLGSLTALSKAGDDARTVFLSRATALLSSTKVIKSYKHSVFDYLEDYAGVRYKGKGEYEVDDNSVLVEACKKAKTFGFVGYVSKSRLAREKEERAKALNAETAKSTKVWLSERLSGLLKEATKMAGKKKVSVEFKTEWSRRVVVLENLIKTLK